MTTTKTKVPGVMKREGARGTRYDVYFRDDTGKQRTRTFATFTAAREFKQSTEVAVRRGEYVDTTATTTVAEFAKVYLTAHAADQRETTQAHQRSLVKQNIDGTTLGGMALTKVRVSDVDSWIAALFAKGRARSTVRNRASFLRSVFAYAVEDGRIRTAPPVRLPKADTSRTAQRDVHPVVAAEARRLSAAMPTTQEAVMVLVQQGCGLRRAELLGLRFADVSVEFRVVKVTGQMGERGERKDYAKTDDSIRTVPMPDPVLERVRAWLATVEVTDTDAVCFPNPKTGRSYRLQVWGRTIAAAVAAAGLPSSTTSHDLRHGFAVDLLRQGVPAHVVGRLMGHADGAQVTNTYSAWLPDDDRLARDAMGRAWATGAASPRLAVAR